jgi:acyl-coenzyme A thioesterase PaaI-like protein
VVGYIPATHMRVTELCINSMMGIRLASPDDSHLLELPKSVLLLNHLGTVHASAQFALAEACSAEFLLRQLGNQREQAFAVLRTSEVKFRRPAHGTLRASPQWVGDTNESLCKELAVRGRALASVRVEVSDVRQVITMTGRYDWFLQRHASTTQDHV